MNWSITYICDSETYPTIFSAGFEHAITGERIQFILNERQNDLPLMRDWLLSFEGKLNLVCHNILNYDGPIFRAILELADKLGNDDLMRLSRLLFERPDSFRKGEFYKRIRDYRKTSKHWTEYDTLEILRVNKTRVSLKHAEVMLRWPKLQDLPYKPGQILNEEEQDLLVNYMWNDIGANGALVRTIARELTIREGVKDVYGVDVHTENRTGIGKAVLDKIYPQKAGIKIQDIRDLRSSADVISLKDCIGKNIEFITPEFIKLREIIGAKKVYSKYNFKYIYHFEHNEVVFTLGIGGIHSEDGLKPGMFRTNDEYIIRDLDINSQYPIIKINNRFYPLHLDGDLYISILEELTQERLDAKKLGKAGDKFQEAKAATLKIVINSIYGLLGMPYYWLYSPKTLVSVTISGQLYILDLVEKLYLAGIPTISANTDGIVCKIPRNLENVYFEVCEQWQKRTSFDLSFTDYALYARRDVNNYITIKSDGETKAKGVFQNYPAFRYDFGKGLKFYQLPLYNYVRQNVVPSDTLLDKYETVPDFAKAYFAPIISIALYQYFVHNVAPNETIRDHKDITDFLISQRSDAEKFDVVATAVKDGDLENETMQKTNRYFVTHLGHGIALHKDHKLGGKDNAMLAGQHVVILNDIDDYDASRYNINYDWYERSVWATINEIDPPKAALW